MPKLDDLLKKGYRRSNLRKAIWSILETSNAPLSVEDIKILLKEHHLRPNKTSIYREISTLVREQMVSEVQLMDGKKRFEILDEKSGKCYLLNMDARRPIKIDISEDLQKLKSRIEREYGVKIFDNQLLFFAHS